MVQKILRALLPHFFYKEPIPPITDSGLLTAIKTVKQSASLELALEKAVEILAAKYEARRFMTYLQFYKSFEKDPNKLWHKHGFMHCTLQNYLLRVLLVASGWLREEDIQLGYSLIWYISPHQYLKISLPKGEIAVDPWNYQHHVPIGFYASGFGSKAISPQKTVLGGEASD